VKCESRVALAVGRGEFGILGRETPAVGSRYPRTSERTVEQEDQVRV
jgi:hypothetical protein